MVNKSIVLIEDIVKVGNKEKKICEWYGKHTEETKQKMKVAWIKRKQMKKDGIVVNHEDNNCSRS
jgi:hypoxanthine-guanine phosphoribosyltransferase